MKTLGFQTFLCNPEAKPRGIQLIKLKEIKSHNKTKSVLAFNFFYWKSDIQSDSNDTIKNF